ncbi:MAG: hypothetical protein EU547_04280 [Promethearchaeota archaeon]|nr:MAG: hypothetical protein EU547_04280 [Candidatus Lokiarchaeota archaeon]
MTLKKDHQFCSNCVLPNGFLNIRLDEHGVCDFCRDPSFLNPNWKKVRITKEMRNNAFQDWTSTIEAIQSSNEGSYDCIVGYSGGKDSTALLDMLINELHLRVLALTIDTGLMTDIAKQNIKTTLTTLDYQKHHLLIEEATPTFSKLYRFLFLHHHTNIRSLTISICDYCSDLIHSIMVKEAIRRNIPLIILGYSSDQIKRYFYEIPEEEMRSDWTPDFIYEDPFTKEDQQWFFTDKDLKNSSFPRILLPYHVLDYNEANIIKKVTSKGLIPQGHTDPVLTNCHVVKAGLMYDLYRYGGIPYALQYAELVRQEEEEKRPRTRKKWLRLYKSIGKAILDGKFAKEGIEMFLSRIGISKNELLHRTEKELETDPQKEIIKQNLTLLE